MDIFMYTFFAFINKNGKKILLKFEEKKTF